jgi:GNAT superfamily N-acetyltransferase
MIEIKNLIIEEIEDIFQVCSVNKISSTLKHGQKLKRNWLKKFISNNGSCIKIAYQNEEPVGQIMFFAEKDLPFLNNPRIGVININCIYSLQKVRGKGVGSALLESLIEDAKVGLNCLDGRKCQFITTQPFNTNENFSMNQFYKRKGFKTSDNEMYLEIYGEYIPLQLNPYQSNCSDVGKALIFYDNICEYSYHYANEIKNKLLKIDPNLQINMINKFSKPNEAKKRNNNNVIINGKPIKSFHNTEEFSIEVRKVL